MGKDDKEFIAHEEVDAERSNDVLIDADTSDESYDIHVKTVASSDDGVNSASGAEEDKFELGSFELGSGPSGDSPDVVDEFSSESGDLDKELDRVESIDTGKVTEPVVPHEEANLDQASARDEAEADATRAVNLDHRPSVDDRGSSDTNQRAAAIGAMSNSHHEFQKQHQKRRILQVLLALFILATIGACAAAGFFYMQAAESQDILSRTDAELLEARSQRDAMQRQLNDQVSTSGEAELMYEVIDALEIQYPVNDAASNVVHGYGGTTADGVTYVHFTTRQLADHQQVSDGRQVFPCGIGMSSPITVVRGSQSQLEALGATEPLSGQKQLGTYSYALLTPQQPCSAEKASEIQAARAAIAELYTSFEAITSDAQAGDDATVETQNP